MYLKFYGLTETPFSLNPDPDFLYLGDKHKAAYSQMECGLLNQAPFSVLTGDVGMGKTVIIRRLINQIQSDENYTVGLMTNTQLTAKDLLRWILFTFNLDCPEEDEAKSHQIFYDFLIDEYAQNRQVILIVDEAQNLDVETLERLRLLSNINADKHQVLQTFLVGQDGLQEMLKKPELKQFAQRITYSFQLEPFNKLETHAYILHRLAVAGSENRKIFSIGACDRVFHYSQGTPRLINVLCDAALVYGYSDDLQLIDSDIIEEIVRDKRKGHILPISDLSFVPEEHVSNDIEALHVDLDNTAAKEIETQANNHEETIESDLFAEDENSQERLFEQQIIDKQADVDEDESSAGAIGLPVPTYTEIHALKEQPGIHGLKMYGGLLLLLVFGLFLWNLDSNNNNNSFQVQTEKNDFDKLAHSEINLNQTSAENVSEQVNNSDGKSMITVNVAIPEQTDLNHIDRDERSTSELEFQNQDITKPEIKLVKQHSASVVEVEKIKAPDKKESGTVQIALDTPNFEMDGNTNKPPPEQVVELEKNKQISKTSEPEGVIDTSIEKVKNFFQFLSPDVETLLSEDKIRVVVKPGDTLSNIMIRETGEFTQTSLNKVVQENPGIVNANRIYIGQVIYISNE